LSGTTQSSQRLWLLKGWLSALAITPNGGVIYLKTETKLKTKIATIFLLFFISIGTSSAQKTVSFPFVTADNQTDTVNGTIWLPTKSGKNKAVILLHGGGGAKAGITRQYAELFSQNDFVSLELEMFKSEPVSPLKHLAQLFGAIDYLASSPNVDKSEISILGLSYGASLALYSGTSWANTKFNKDRIKINSIAALYPICYFHERLATQESRTTKRMTNFGFPADFYESWTGIPIKIYVGSNDDFENRDPNSCQSFVAALKDKAQQEKIQVQVIPNATHGWDQGRTYSFSSPLACKGSGCNNTNESNPAVTQTVKDDLLKFLK
jgi:dienelactone hydrolase